MYENPQIAKVYYRPIEAAIRWAGLLRYKNDILSSMSPPRHLPETLDCPRWGELRLYTDRIYDAIFNGELPYGRDGITLNDQSLWNSPDLTIRHIDLKRWMRQGAFPKTWYYCQAAAWQAQPANVSQRPAL